MFNSYQYSDSYDDLLKGMIRHAQQNEVDNQIVEILKQFFEKELGKENRPFSRPERVLLFQQVAKAVWTDVLGKIDSAT
ncbi:MAG: hypothetical protein HZB18_12035 [Chloroflexi bacterium]|nr:hypothetical protein [Chloroflexota bacterium]